MPRTTHSSILRSHLGSGRRTTPAALAGNLHVKADCGLATKQLVGILPKNARISAVSVVGNTTDGGTQPSAGTFQVDLEATAAPLLVQALVNVVAALATIAIGSKTVVAASLLKPWPTDRTISVTIAGGTAGQVLWLAIEAIPADDGKI
jgi:hypothetical protein